MDTLLQHIKLTEGISYLVSLTFAIGYIGFWRYLTGREVPAPAVSRVADLVPNTVQGFALPANAFYHPGHGWAMLEADGLVRIGVDDFLPRAIGRLDAVELPRPGDRVALGRPAFSLIQGQRRANVPAPVSGVVAEINPALAGKPGLIKERGFGAGWVARVRPTSLSEDLPRLHVAERASEWLKREVDASSRVHRRAYRRPRRPARSHHGRRRHHWPNDGRRRRNLRRSARVTR